MENTGITCSKCSVTKLPEAFHVRKNGKLRRDCKTCQNQRARQYNKTRRKVYPRSVEPKQCTVCGLVKAADDFISAKHHSDGLSSSCRECDNKRRLDNKLKDPDYWKRHYERHKDATRAYQLGRWYGITPARYDEMLNQQGDKCRICGRHYSEFSKRLHVDHDHKTGVVRALLCSNCNSMLGMSGDDASVLRLAADYIEQWKDT